MSCSIASLSFAHKRLAALTVMSGLEASEIYDKMFGRLRHALMIIHAFVPRAIAADLSPLLDLLTNLHLGSMEPIAAGVLSQQGGSLQEAGQALDQEVGVVLASKVQLALILPASSGPEARAAMVLSELMRGLGEDRGLLQ